MIVVVSAGFKVPDVPDALVIKDLCQTLFCFFTIEKCKKYKYLAFIQISKSNKVTSETKMSCLHNNRVGWASSL